MLALESIESVSLMSVWMLEPRVPELLLELGMRGYATARVRPLSLGGYNIVPLMAPNVMAIKGLTHLVYDPGRRSITIEGPRTDELLSVFNEVEEVLRSAGSDPAKGVLFYELQAKARASGRRWTLRRSVTVAGLQGLELLVVPTSLVSGGDDPNSVRWLSLEVRPLWSSWGDERVRYEVVMVYRDRRERLVEALKNLDGLVKEILGSASAALEGNA